MWKNKWEVFELFLNKLTEYLLQLQKNFGKIQPKCRTTNSGKLKKVWNVGNIREEMLCTRRGREGVAQLLPVERGGERD